MIPDVLKGLPIGIGLVLLTISVGFGIGLWCSGGEYEVDTPEESDYAPEVDEEAQLYDELGLDTRVG